jgi:hypothetical protein
MAIKMMNKLDKFGFGKHKGETVRHVIEHDPEYILWLDSENIVEFSREILDNAEDYSGEDDSYFFDYPDLAD